MTSMSPGRQLSMMCICYCVVEGRRRGRPIVEGACVNLTCLQTLELLTRALDLMDKEGRDHIAARIAMAIDDLTDDRSSSEHTTIN
jgi:hypothetical protein